MKWTMPLLALVVLLPIRGPAAVAQDPEPASAPFIWKLSGATVADFRIELVAAKPIDQSSAEACVRSFMDLVDQRESSLKTLNDLQQRIDAVIATDLKADMKRLMSDDLVVSPPVTPVPKTTTGNWGSGWTLAANDKFLPTFAKGAEV